MFAVFDRYGNIRSSGLGEHGLYYDGTRFLSRLMLSLGETPPLFLSSGVRADNSLFSADLTNVDILSGDHVELPRGTIHMVRSRLLWDGVCYEQLRLTNYGSSVVKIPCGSNSQPISPTCSRFAACLVLEGASVYRMLWLRIG